MKLRTEFAEVGSRTMTAKWALFSSRWLLLCGSGLTRVGSLAKYTCGSTFLHKVEKMSINPSVLILGRISPFFASLCVAGHGTVGGGNSERL